LKLLGGAKIFMVSAKLALEDFGASGYGVEMI
jgi:hypothetical protein